MTFSSPLLVAAWFLLPPLVGLALGWKWVVATALVYPAIVWALSEGLGAILPLAGSGLLLIPFALFIAGVDLAIYALIRLFIPAKKAEKAPE